MTESLPSIESLFYERKDESGVLVTDVAMGPALEIFRRAWVARETLMNGTDATLSQTHKAQQNLECAQQLLHEVFVARLTSQSSRPSEESK